MRCQFAVVVAIAFTSGSAESQDVCAGASASKAMSKSRMAGPAASRSAPGAAREPVQLGVARGASMYPGSGAGPIPDVTDWKPRGKIPIGTELVVQGRNLVPGQLIALFGGLPLTPTAQSPSEIRFRVTDLAEPGALIVYNTNGQPRTLESAYYSYDPTPYVTRIVPASFGQGDLVTICGTSLFNAFFDDVYSELPVDGVPHIAQVRQSSGKFVRIGPEWLAVVNPAVSPAGDRITFLAGSVYTTARACNGRASCSSPAGITDFAAGFKTMPASVTGPLTVKLSGVNQWVLGPALTWNPPVPRLTKVYGKLLGKATPYVLLPTGNTIGVDAYAHVEGVNLEWSKFRFGAVDIMSTSNFSPTHRGLTLPLNVTSGAVCATLGSNTQCSGSVEVFGGPVISRVPTMPLALRTAYTIEGLNLLPPPTTGLTYRLSDRLGQLQAIPVVVACNMVFQVLEHTATKIVFRIGDPAIRAPVAADCLTGPLFQQNAQQMLTLWARLSDGTQGGLSNIGPLYLKP